MEKNPVKNNAFWPFFGNHRIVTDHGIVPQACTWWRTLTDSFGSKVRKLIL